VDGERFDLLTVRISPAVSRRRLGASLGLLGLGASLGSSLETQAKKRKKPKKKPLRCPPGTDPRCPRAAAPHWCASAAACVPACPTGTRYDDAACSCECVVRRSCCQCTGGSSPFCRTDIDEGNQCALQCSGGNSFFAAQKSLGMTGSCDTSGRCAVTCAPPSWGTTDACKGSPGGCQGDLKSFQPLGGGPTRCGRPTLTGSCGCASHQQCADAHGIGAFCVQITGGACVCNGADTFCATQA
jgi:hypothetical protein